MTGADKTLSNDLPQARDLRLKGGGASLRQLEPQVLEQPLGRHDLVRAKQQIGEKRALARPAERKRSTPRSCLEQPEDTELHGALRGDRSTEMKGIQCRKAG